MTINFWFEFSILFVACMIGSTAVLPYSLRLLKGSGKPLKASLQKLVLLSMLQNAVLFAVVTGVGLWAAHSIGLGAPYIEAMLMGTAPAQPLVSMIEIATVLGMLAGAALLIVYHVFGTIVLRRKIEARA